LISRLEDGYVRQLQRLPGRTRRLLLLPAAELGPLDDLQRARLERLRAQIAFTRMRGRDAPGLLLDAASRLERLDAGLARESYLDALRAAIFAGRLGDGVQDAAEAARAAPAGSQPPPRAMGLLLDGLAKRFTEGYAAGVAPLRRALNAFAGEDGPLGIDSRRSLRAALATGHPGRVG
jgi:hypothetical protein